MRTCVSPDWRKQSPWLRWQQPVDASPHNASMSEYIIGLTGGVASGKSAVETCFRALGVAVADADAAARAALAVAARAATPGAGDEAAASATAATATPAKA